MPGALFIPEAHRAFTSSCLCTLSSPGIVPKDRIIDITTFVADIIEAHESGERVSGKWFARLKPFFDRKFKPGWRQKDEAFWREFDRRNVVYKEDVDEIL